MTLLVALPYLLLLLLLDLLNFLVRVTDDIRAHWNLLLEIECRRHFGVRFRMQYR